MKSITMMKMATIKRIHQFADEVIISRESFARVLRRVVCARRMEKIKPASVAVIPSKIPEAWISCPAFTLINIQRMRIIRKVSERA